MNKEEDTVGCLEFVLSEPLANRHVDILTSETIGLRSVS